MNEIFAHLLGGRGDTITEVLSFEKILLKACPRCNGDTKIEKYRSYGKMHYEDSCIQCGKVIYREEVIGG